jgi:hypothetical protein
MMPPRSDRRRRSGAYGNLFDRELMSLDQSTQETARAIGVAVPVEVCRRELAREFIRRHGRHWRYDRRWRRWFSNVPYGYWWPSCERLQIEIQNLSSEAVREADRLGQRRLVMALGTTTNRRAIDRLLCEELAWPIEPGRHDLSSLA